MPFLPPPEQRLVPLCRNSALFPSAGTACVLPSLEKRLFCLRRNSASCSTSTNDSKAAATIEKMMRTHPTTSNRQRRAETKDGVADDGLEANPNVVEQRHEVHEETTDIDREQEGHVGEDEEGQTVEDETYPFPGGPIEMTVLNCYLTHVSKDIWKSKDRRPLRCVHHHKKLADWDIHDSRITQLIEASGLYPLTYVSYKTINRMWISSLVERWYPETNTFHMPFGEMTITLDDVQQLIGIPVRGHVVVTPDFNSGELVDLCVNALGIDKEEIEDQLSKCKGKGLTLNWLRDTFRQLPEDATQEDIDCAARAYILYFLGCTIMCDKSGTKVPAKYLNLLMNVDSIGKYAWGAALAFLYLQLGIASRTEARQIGGYLTLLEAWSYEHIKIERSVPNVLYEKGQPRALLWKGSISQPINPAHKLIKFREALDHLDAREVIWDPYREERAHYPQAGNSLYSGFLFCFQIREPHNPARVLREFGFIQTIPPPPPQPIHKGSSRGAHVKGYKLVYDANINIWKKNNRHTLPSKECGNLCRNPWDCAPMGLCT